MRKGRFILAACLIAGGSVLAAWVQTNGGSVSVHDVRFVGAADNLMSGYLYVPDDAGPSAPASAVLAVHGYINSRETQSGFAIELARRGFVVLAPDQTGHGYSDPPAFSAGFGGPDALAYLRSLPFVDTSRVGLEGHSMGGWAVQMAAAAYPDGYAAMVLEGSSTGTFGAPAGTPERPENLAVVFSRFDEFSELMWGAPVPADIVGTPKLQSLFGTEAPVEVGRLYGDPAAGTARRLFMPAVTHPGDHLSTEAIGDAVEWLELMLGRDSGLAVSDQVWYWKELGTLIALAGLALLIFPLLDWLLGSPRLAAVVTRPPAPVRHSKAALAANMILAALIPVVLFFPLQVLGNLVLPPNAVLPQQITNGILVWAWGVGLFALGSFAFWFRKSGLTLAELGLPRAWPVVGRAAALALALSGVLYAVVAAVQFFLHVDFRFWVVALKALSADQFLMFLLYLPLFTVFFLVLSLALHSQLRRASSLGAAMWTNGLVLSGGFVLLLLVQYVPLLAGGTLTVAQPLLTIVAFQFVPLLFLVGLVSTYCFVRTNNVYTGAFVNGVFITWYMVAGTATQAVPFWM